MKLKWSDIGSKLKGAAPLIGKALSFAGPGPALVGEMLSNVLGVENNPDAIDEALKKDPQSLVKIRALESNERIEIHRVCLEEQELYLKDMQDARKNHKNSNMPAIICFMLTPFVAIFSGILCYHQIPESNQSIVYMVFGSLLTFWGNSIAYFVGTTRSSARKTEMMSQDK